MYLQIVLNFHFRCIGGIHFLCVVKKNYFDMILLIGVQSHI